MLKNQKNDSNLLSGRPPFSNRMSSQFCSNLTQPNLPFSLQDHVTKEAMELLGVNYNELELLPLQHFIKMSKTEENAKVLYQNHIKKRKEVIKLIQENRRLIMSTVENTENAKDSGDLVYERHMTEVNNKQLNEKQKINNTVLRRLAINQLRQALRYQKGEKINEKVDTLSRNHTEKLEHTLNTAKTLAEKTEFSRKREGHFDDCLFHSKIGEKGNDIERRRKHQELIEQRQKKFEDEVKKTEKKTIKVRNKQESEYQNLISHRLERVDKTDYRYSLIEGKLNQRDQKLNERGEKRVVHTKDVNRRNFTIEKNRVERAIKKFDTQTQNSKVVLQQNQEIISQKITEEKKILEKRNKAADEIYTSRRKKIEEFDKFLGERDVNIDQKIQAQKMNEFNRLNEIRKDLEDKTQKIVRAKRTRDCATICVLRNKIARNYSGLEDARSHRARSEFSKVVEHDNFAEKRDQILTLMPQLIDLDDNQRIKKLMQVLKIDEEEAIDILEVAKKPASIH